MADLNKDGLPDLIEVRNDTLRVMKQTSTGTFQQVFSMPVTLGLNVAAGDFDGNGYKDIYVVGSCSSTGTGFPPDSPDHILYNNYDGINNAWSFSSQTIPAIMPKGGCGDDVAALDYNGDGLSDFFVTNGRRQERGPTQLWTYGPDQATSDTIPPDTTVPYPNIQRLSSVSSTGSVPVDVKWLGTDASGISAFHLDKSNDGGQTFNGVYTGMGINQTYQLMPGTGPYQFRLNAVDNAGNTSAWAYSPRVATELRQQDASNFTYSGSWATQSLFGASGGSVKSSSSVGDTMTLVTPSGARWFGLVSDLGPDRGKANITFDGNAVGNIDLYSATVQNRKIVWQRGLKTGTTHTVKLVLTGADPSSLGNRVDVDGLATFFNP
ncbi:MAG: VCBS repeat-containing protein [Actinobacteria bacterium]|nr:VCBS repeat-containing protein [Actinomycetota bacterium]